MIVFVLDFMAAFWVGAGLGCVLVGSCQMTPKNMIKYGTFVMAVGIALLFMSVAMS